MTSMSRRKAIKNPSPPRRSRISFSWLEHSIYRIFKMKKMMLEIIIILMIILWLLLNGLLYQERMSHLKGGERASDFHRVAYTLFQVKGIVDQYKYTSYFVSVSLQCGCSIYGWQCCSYCVEQLVLNQWKYPTAGFSI